MLLAELAREAVLLIALSQPQPAPEPTVPVILHPDLPIVVMSVSRAEKWLATETDPKWRAALVWALGTRPTRSDVKLESWDRERERFQRQPVNGKMFGGDP
jgi:hypothetical protein